MSMKKIGILGSGIIGLSLGYKISKLFKDYKITIFEKDSDFEEHHCRGPRRTFASNIT